MTHTNNYEIIAKLIDADAKCMPQNPSLAMEIASSGRFDRFLISLRADIEDIRFELFYPLLMRTKNELVRGSKLAQQTNLALRRSGMYMEAQENGRLTLRGSLWTQGMTADEGVAALSERLNDMAKTMCSFEDAYLRMLFQPDEQEAPEPQEEAQQAVLTADQPTPQEEDETPTVWQERCSDAGKAGKEEEALEEALLDQDEEELYAGGLELD